MSKSITGQKTQVRLLNEALDEYSLEAVKATLSQSNLTNSQIKSVLSFKGLKGEILETTTAEISNTIATRQNTVAQAGNTTSTVGLGVAFKGLAIKIKEATIAMGKFLFTTPAGWLTLATTAITGMVLALNHQSKAMERAQEKTSELIDEYESITSEVETLEGKLDELQSQINSLDPITNEQDIKNLQLESAELKAQLAILKEKQALAKEEAHNASMDSLGMTVDSKYAQGETEYVSTISDGSNTINLTTPIEMTKPKQVTEYEELELAMEAYRAYATEVLKLNEELDKLEKDDKKDSTEYLEKSKAIEDYTAKMADARSHANELTQSVSEQADGLDEAKESEFKGYLEDLILRYSDFTDEINGNTNALNANAEAQSQTVDESGSSFSYDKLGEIPQKLSEVENAYKTAQDALDSYNKKGYYSMDIIDSILSLEDEYINVLVDENGQLQVNSDSMNKLCAIKIETAKASIYQETCEELVRIKTLDTALAAQELALINGTLTESAYETAKALYEEVIAMGGANAALAGKVWDSATKKVKVLDNQLKSLNNNTYNVGVSAMAEDAEKATKEYIESLRILNSFCNLHFRKC